MLSNAVKVWCFVALAGCSFVAQPRRSLEPHARQPSVAPIVADTVIAAGVAAFGISETQVTCSDSQFLCLSGIDHAIGGVAIGVAALYAVSALYGYGRYAEAPPAAATSQLVPESDEERRADVKIVGAQYLAHTSRSGF